MSYKHKLQKKRNISNPKKKYKKNIWEEENVYSYEAVSNTKI